MGKPNTALAAFKEAIVEAGSASALARLVGVQRQAVFQALARGYVPLPWCKKIEAAYKISSRRLRPDAFE